MPITLQPNLCLLRFGRQPSDQAQLGRAYPLEREKERVSPFIVRGRGQPCLASTRGATMKSRGKMIVVVVVVVENAEAGPDGFLRAPLNDDFDRLRL